MYNNLIAYLLSSKMVLIIIALFILLVVVSVIKKLIKTAFIIAVVVLALSYGSYYINNVMTTYQFKYENNVISFIVDKEPIEINLNTLHTFAVQNAGKDSDLYNTFVIIDNKNNRKSLKIPKALSDLLEGYLKIKSKGAD